MILCFGELLLRLSPDVKKEWINNNSLNTYLGGSELNVVSALAKWRVPVNFNTVLPGNFIAKNLVNRIKDEGIDTSTIMHQGDKIGVYYLMQHEALVYDRINSSFYNLQPGIINWDKVLNGIRWFHFNLATASLNENLIAVYKEALEVCTKKNVSVSVDINYDESFYNDAIKTNKPLIALLQHCDFIIGNIDVIEKILSIETSQSISKETHLQQAKKVDELLMKQFPKCKVVANPFHFNKTDVEYYGAVFSNNVLYSSASYKSNEFIDASGATDAFTAGIIYGIYNHLPFQQIINFANAAAFQKLFIIGNNTNKTAEEVKAFIQQYKA